MANQISGRIIKILPSQTGAGKNGSWIKQDMVIETLDQYPKKICCTAWGDLATNLDSYEVGEKVTVHFNLESREYNDKWFTDVRAWKIEREGAKPEKPKGQPTADTATKSVEEEDDPLPF